MHINSGKVLLRWLRKNSKLMTFIRCSESVNSGILSQIDITTGTCTCLTTRGLITDLSFYAQRSLSTNSPPETCHSASSSKAVTFAAATSRKADGTATSSGFEESEFKSDAVPAMETDADAARYLAEILGRDIKSKFPRAHSRIGEEQKTLIAIEPGSGIIVRHLLERHPNLEVRASYRVRREWSESDSSLCASFPGRYSAVDVNFWTNIVTTDPIDATVDLETIFYGEEETYRRENERISRSPFKSKEAQPCLTAFATPITKPVTLFGFAMQRYVSRLMERLVDAMVEPETSLLGRFVPDSVFYFVLPSSMAPVDVSGGLPEVESKDRGNNLVLITSPRFQSNKMQRTRSALIQTFYDVKALAAVCPHVVAEASSFKQVKKSYPYMLIRITAKKQDEIFVKPERRQSFALFMTTICASPEKRVIPAVEEYLPDMGPTMIMEGGFVMSELTKDLTLSRILKIFDMMAENPMYGESIFGLVESGQMNADEWLKKRLVIKKGFVRAHYVN